MSTNMRNISGAVVFALCLLFSAASSAHGGYHGGGYHGGYHGGGYYGRGHYHGGYRGWGGVVVAPYGAYYYSPVCRTVRVCKYHRCWLTRYCN